MASKHKRRQEEPESTGRMSFSEAEAPAPKTVPKKRTRRKAWPKVNKAANALIELLKASGDKSEKFAAKRLRDQMENGWRKKEKFLLPTKYKDEINTLVSALRNRDINAHARNMKADENISEAKAKKNGYLLLRGKGLGGFIRIVDSDTTSATPADKPTQKELECAARKNKRDYFEGTWYRAAGPSKKARTDFERLRELLRKPEPASQKARAMRFDSLFKFYSNSAFSKKFQKKHAMLEEKLKEAQTAIPRTRQEQKNLSAQIRALEADVAVYRSWVKQLKTYAAAKEGNDAKLAQANAKLWAKSHSALFKCTPSALSLISELRPIELGEEPLHKTYAHIRNNIDPCYQRGQTIEMGSGEEAEKKALALGAALIKYPQLLLNAYTVRIINYSSEGKEAWRVELGTREECARGREEDERAAASQKEEKKSKAQKGENSPEAPPIWADPAY